MSHAICPSKYQILWGSVKTCREFNLCTRFCVASDGGSTHSNFIRLSHHQLYHHLSSGKMNSQVTCNWIKKNCFTLRKIPVSYDSYWKLTLKRNVSNNPFGHFGPLVLFSGACIWTVAISVFSYGWMITSKVCMKRETKKI